MPTNVCMPYYEPGARLTADATAAVTGKRFVVISADRLSGPGLNNATDGGNIRVAPAGAGVRALGVAEYDAGTGTKVGVIATPGTVVPVTAGGAIAAGAEVQCDATGQAITLAAGKALGLCLSAAAGGADAQIKLY